MLAIVQNDAGDSKAENDSHDDLKSLSADPKGDGGSSQGDHQDQDSVQEDLISPESGSIENSPVQQKRSAASSSERALLAALSTNALEESISVRLA